MTSDNLKIMPDTAHRLIGLARRSGGAVIGTSAVIESLRTRKPSLVVCMASDASERTKKQLCDKCEYHGVQLFLLDIGCEELGHLLGKSGSVAAVGVVDKNMAQGLTALVK